MSKKNKKNLERKYQNFEQFNKDMHDVEGYIANVFKEEAMRAGIEFVNTAKKQTKTARLIDTGYYRDNWTTDLSIKQDDFIVKCYNPVEYASFLEYGYKRKGTGRRFEGRFIGTYAVRKAQEYAIKNLKERLGDMFQE